MAFETFNGRVIAGAVVSADGSSWAPVHDGVVALSQISAGSASHISGRSCASRHPLAAMSLVIGNGPPRPILNLRACPLAATAEPLLAHVAGLAKGLQTGSAVVVIGDNSGWAACSAAALLPDQVGDRRD